MIQWRQADHHMQLGRLANMYVRAYSSYRLRCEKHLPKEVQYIDDCPDSCKLSKPAYHSDYTDTKNKLQFYHSNEKKKNFINQPIQVVNERAPENMRERLLVEKLEYES